MHRESEQLISLAVILAIVVVAYYRKRWLGSGTAHGTSRWADILDLKNAGMLDGKGLLLGRTLEDGQLIRIASYVHGLVISPSGGGKGVSFVIPQLLDYKESCLVNDTKGDLFAVTAEHRRKMGHTIVRLAPLSGGGDALNPLDHILDDDLLVDRCKAMAGSLVIATGKETELHWNQNAGVLIGGVSAFVAKRFDRPERNLVSVREIIGNPELLDAATKNLLQMGGVYARVGYQIGGWVDKERAGIISTALRNLAWTDSEPIGRAVSSSTFDPAALASPSARITVYLQIEPEFANSHRGLLRCWTQTILGAISRAGNEQCAEVLFLCDEASMLGDLPALEEAMVRGRSSGIRCFLAFQSDAQIAAAFPEKPTLLYDNCSTQIYLGAAASYETAERISKQLGSQTWITESVNEGESRSSGHELGQDQRNWNTGRSLQEIGRDLLQPSEVMTMDNNLLIAFVRGGGAPILAQRIKYFSDSLFRTAFASPQLPPSFWWALIVLFAGVVWAALHGGMPP